MSDRTDPRANTSPTEEFSSAERDPFDRIAEEFAGRCRAGESPSIAEYEARFPEDAEKVRGLLGAVAMMEQLRRGSRQVRALPERLGEFRVLRELGRGGMGVVYEAVQESLGRHVAVKAIHHVHLDPRRLQRFQREAQAVAQLHHTNIVPIFGVGEHDGLPYYVMQYIRGEGLDAHLDRWRAGGASKPEDRWRFAARVGIQAAGALHHAHEQGVLHRDIKPSNLLIDEQDTLWITDFGLAKLAGRDDLTATGDVIGTLRYLAPESLRGETDRRGDVYSLGLTLYELITLNSPFGELGPSELLRRVGEGDLPPPRRLVPNIPADLETILLKSIAREPADRYATAADLADDLRRFLEDRPIRARRANAFERLYRWSRRNKAVASLAAAAAGSLVLAAVVGWIGYASTAAALARESVQLRRADGTVDLALEVFGQIFEKLAPNVNLAPPPLGMQRRGPGGPGAADGPGRDPGPVGPGARKPGRGGPGRALASGPGGLSPDGPGRDHGPGRPGGRGMGPPDEPGSGSEDDGRGPGPPPDFDGHGPMGGPRGGVAGTDLPMLLTVLSFYDRFAQQNRNATGPDLQSEVAQAYRKVGALYLRLGRPDEAEEAIAKAAAIFEGFLAKAPADPETRFKLAQTYALTDPGSAPDATLERSEKRLERAGELIDRLAEESPGDFGRDHLREKIRYKLGLARERLGHYDRAEASYREAIGIADALLGRWPEEKRPEFDRMAIREALAGLLIVRGRGPDARELLDVMAREIRSMKGIHGPFGLVLDRSDVLAGLFRKLGEADRAEEIERWAAALRAKPPGDAPDSPGESGPGRDAEGPGRRKGPR